MMKAVAYTKSLPISDAAALQDVGLPEPTPAPRDLLVDVRAVSVNPVDTKVRQRIDPGGEPKVLGYDASGVVVATGDEATLFKPGDEVWYAGAINRPGTNSERHVVDERIVGRKPASLSHAEAAALPLTTITAWELLFDRLGVAEGSGNGESLLIIGGAGGVGSILTQLARRSTGLTVVATASRDDTRTWCEAMGAHHVVNHREPLEPQLASLGVTPRYVAGLTATDKHFPAIARLIAPQGKLGLIDDPDPSAIDITQLKQKAVSLHWEFMFARPLFETDDLIEQHRLLCRAAELVDAGALRTTANHDGGKITSESLRAAHARQESGAAIGKTVLEW